MKKICIEKCFIPTTLDERTIRVLLPDDYESTNKSYGGHSWGIYESKHELNIHERMEDMIIVGIDNSPLRMSEYSPWKNNFKISDRDFMDTGGQGDLYAQFIVETILPFIEEKYRINKNQRYVAGSSMGAYISMYIISKYPKEFIGAGIFSLASWFNEEPFIDYVEKSKLMKNSQFFISIGRHETSSQAIKDFNQIYLNNSRRLRDLLIKKGITHVEYIETDDTHNELAWRKMFPKFYRFINQKAK